MPKLEKARAGGTVVSERKPRPFMPVFLRGVPTGHNWGWYSREDPRMHVQSVERKYDYRIWLENRGQKVFEPEGKIPARVLKALREAVTAKRQLIDDNWVALMLDKDWIALHIALPKLTLVAYPNTPTKFTRVIDLSTWLNPKLLASLAPDIIELNREMAALRLWTNRPDEQAYDVRLSRLLWTD
jgi:hypothetical protein